MRYSSERPSRPSPPPPRRHRAPSRLLRASSRGRRSSSRSSPPSTRPDAEAAGIEGSVELAIVIDEHGEVQQAVVIDPGPHPGFAPAALHAVQQFRFRPAEIDGAPAAVEITYRYDFVLRRAPPAAAPAEAPVVLSGRVIERGTRTPVAGASLDVAGVAAETDADGRFEVRGVAPGPVKVRIVSPEHEPLTVDEKIEAGKRRRGRVPALAADLRSVRIRRARRAAAARGERPYARDRRRSGPSPAPRATRSRSSRTCRASRRSPFGIGLLVVRGSEPSETNVYLDGIQVPLLFHFGGITSVVSSDVIRVARAPPGQLRDPLRTRAGRRRRSPHARRRATRSTAPRSSTSSTAASRWRARSAAATASSRCGGAGWMPCSRSPCRASRRTPRRSCASPPATGTTRRKLTRTRCSGGTLSLLAYGSDDKLEFVERSEATGRPTFYLSTVFHRIGARWRRALGPARNDLVLAIGRDSFDVLQSSNFGVLTEIRSLTLRDALDLARVRSAHARGRRRHDPPLLRLLDLRAAAERARHDRRSSRSAPTRPSASARRAPGSRRPATSRRTFARPRGSGWSPGCGSTATRGCAAGRSGSTLASRRSTTCDPARRCRRPRGCSARRHSRRT